METLQVQFDVLLVKGAQEPVPQGADPGFFSRIFVVPKKSGGIHPFIDLKALNQFLKPRCFKMESAESIRAALLPGKWTCSIYLKDVYFYIPIHPKSRRFHRVLFKGESYQFRALPFSLSSASWLFTMVARELTSLIHTQNTALHQFLEDWLGWAMSREHRDLVFLGKELGWILNLEKSELFPQQVFAFAGIHHNLISFTAHPTLEKWIKIIRSAESLIQASSLPVVTWQSIFRTLQGQSRLVPFGCLQIHPLQWNLSRYLNQFQDPQNTEAHSHMCQANITNAKIYQFFIYQITF